jgi:hypothetical protein
MIATSTDSYERARCISARGQDGQHTCLVCRKKYGDLKTGWSIHRNGRKHKKKWATVLRSETIGNPESTDRFRFWLKQVRNKINETVDTPGLEKTIKLKAQPLPVLPESLLAVRKTGKESVIAAESDVFTVSSSEEAPNGQKNNPWVYTLA